MRERSPPLCLLSLSPFQRIFADSSLLDILYSMLLLISFDFECKVFGFRFTELPSVQWLVLCPLVGLVLSLSLGPHIPPVYHGASLCSVACALSTWGLSLVIVFGIAFP